MDQSQIDKLAKIIWDFNNFNSELKKVDAILVLGSNDIRVAIRGIELFKQGYAPLIIFSGNVGRLTKGMWNKPEAEVFADEAIKAGISKEKIIIENKSTNTGENIIFTKQLLEEKGLNSQSFIVVQKPYMLKRAYATFMKQWPEKKIIMTTTQISFENYPNNILSKEYIINIMVGDLQRLKTYPQKGFQIPMEIPNDVWAAYERLIKVGFTKYLIKE